MEAVIHFIHMIVSNLASVASLVLELFGALILIYNGIKAFIYYVDGKEDTSMNLGEGIAMSLEFLLAGEILNTINAMSISDLYMLGGLVLLRGIMTVEIHWELKNEKKELEEHRKAKEAIAKEAE